jgi:hypothetical protein
MPEGQAAIADKGLTNALGQFGETDVGTRVNLLLAPLIVGHIGPSGLGPWALVSSLIAIWGC